MHKRGTKVGTNVEIVFFILTHLGHGWETGKLAQKVAQEGHKRGTREVQEVHERCTRGAREVHKRCTHGH